jgi:Arc/MetJ-type ribon-helix-helix transcriptional regulator
MSERKARLTVTIDPRVAEYAERLVEAGKAESVSAVVNDALWSQLDKDRRAARLWRDAAERADPEKVARMMAHVEAQRASLPDRFR